ncbi:MAG: M12 family metallo-peptidase [Dokdonella sp.]|uniref:M12 family metallo-peptidase n=1 Tax=Dokdonella sp. TaxID=2291710 RepID=UPI0032634601
MRGLLALLLVVTCVHSVAHAELIAAEQSRLDELGAMAIGESRIVSAFPDGYGGHADIRFERIDVYARGARIVEVTETGEHEVPRSARIELIGSNSAGDVRLSLAFDPGAKAIRGAGSSSAGAFSIDAIDVSGSTRLRVRPTHESLPPGVDPHIVPTDDSLPTGRPMPDALTLSLVGASPAGALRTALIAVDTDNEFMSERFGNSTAAATSWIADLFGVMNVMYQRDLNVTLQQGTTFLRTGKDPYNAVNTPADGTDLTEFGTYWQNNEGGVARDFTVLLSGKSPNGLSASGIAWVNAYCQTQSNGGSYSVNQIFTSAQAAVEFSARIVGHEIGHNFGAYHTHCTNTTTGAAPTGVNTIDKCFAGEAANGCYSGATSCPNTGPGAPAGTLMSYCNSLNGGCGANHQNVLQFHPTQITTMSALIAQNTPSCLSLGSDVIFKNGFE